MDFNKTQTCVLFGSELPTMLGFGMTMWTYLNYNYSYIVCNQNKVLRIYP